ncbi:hypothetical protein [Streptomyces sp. 150FB]|uniref:hypothetical protein n=1 Tax=Streptomyces sp. 150FB TaxID=1576605 RepID=UPI000696EB67|nr:hypothetical protein [Streptomyces sp. 150FB]
MEGVRTARTEEFADYLTRYRVAAHNDAELSGKWLRVTNMSDDPAVYAAAIAVASALIAAMAARVLRKPALADFVMDVGELRGLLWQQLILAGVFCLSVPIAFLSPSTAKYWWLLAFPCRVLYWWVDSQEQRRGTGQAALDVTRASQDSAPGPENPYMNTGDASA